MRRVTGLMMQSFFCMILLIHFGSIFFLLFFFFLVVNYGEYEDVYHPHISVRHPIDSLPAQSEGIFGCKGVIYLLVWVHYQLSFFTQVRPNLSAARPELLLSTCSSYLQCRSTTSRPSNMPLDLHR